MYVTNDNCEWTFQWVSVVKSLTSRWALEVLVVTCSNWLWWRVKIITCCAAGWWWQVIKWSLNTVINLKQKGEMLELEEEHVVAGSCAVKVKQALSQITTPHVGQNNLHQMSTHLCAWLRGYTGDHNEKSSKYKHLYFNENWEDWKPYNRTESCRIPE